MLKDQLLYVRLLYVKENHKICMYFLKYKNKKSIFKKYKRYKNKKNLY